MSYSYLGGFTGNSSGTTFNPSVSVPAGFCVVIVYVEKAAAATATVTVGSNSLTQDSNFFSSGNFLFAAYSGVVSSSSSITITGGVSFGDITCAVWSWSGTGTKNSSNGAAAANITLGVNSGDYLFGAQLLSGTWTGSTQTPTDVGPGSYVITGADHVVTFADWLIASTNASFSVASSSGFADIFAVDYTPAGGGGGPTPNLRTLMGVGS